MLLACVVLVMPGLAIAYRPFVSTDAAVAGADEMEIEFGYVGFRRRGSESTIVAPTLIGNLGLGHDLELVVETKATHELDSRARRSQAEDTAVSVKWVAREGALQGRGTAPSLALELSLLVPTAREERHVGGELIGIASGELFGWTYHLNAGVLADTEQTEPGGVWGVIVEHALCGRLRAVAELNGEAVASSPPDNSALVGAILDVDPPPPLRALSVDVGVRRGISRASDDWSGTAGFTAAFGW